MEHFSSFKEYASFAMAREFIYVDPAKGDFKYTPSKIERLGGFLVTPLLTPADKVLSNIKNPAMIAALTGAALFATTLVFYPSTVARLVDHAWMLHTATFSLSVSTIMGLGLRTLGRLHPLDNALMQAWDRKELIPVPIGSEILQN